MMMIDEPTGKVRVELEAKRGLADSVHRHFVADTMEIRANDDDPQTATFVGHASVTDRSYPMYGGPDKGGWHEYIDSGAFKKTLSEKPDVAFLINHEGMTLARTKSGTLRLGEDKVGLSVDADLDTANPVVQSLRSAMNRGDIDEMSFGFRVVRQVWLDGDGNEVPWWDEAGIERHITEVSLNKGDVSAVNYGANPYTDASLRTLSMTLRELSLDDCEPDELRAAIDHLTSLLPTDPPPPVERWTREQLDALRRNL